MILVVDSIPIDNFNSIKVRLKHTDFDNNTTMDLFQFHKGTIKTYEAGLPSYPDGNFIPERYEEKG